MVQQPTHQLTAAGTLKDITKQQLCSVQTLVNHWQLVLGKSVNPSTAACGDSTTNRETASRQSIWAATTRATTVGIIMIVTGAQDVSRNHNSHCSASTCQLMDIQHRHVG